MDLFAGVNPTMLVAAVGGLVAVIAIGFGARALFGGRKDEISKSPISQACYNCSTALNYKHQLFAYSSLFSVAFADVYVRLCSMGIWSDWRIL